MKWLSLPNAQQDNLFVKGIICNVAANVEGSNTYSPEYIKQSKEGRTLNLFAK